LLERGEPEENMARDRRLLEMVVRGETPFALRFYLWSRPTVSYGLGLGSKALAVLDPDTLSRDGVRVVERPTGGGLLYHGPDLSFGLAMKPFPGAHLRVAQAVARGLARLGVPARVAGRSPVRNRPRNLLCFAAPSPGEVVVEGRKLAGLARRRTRGGLLFQGSVYLYPGPEEILPYLRPGFSPAPGDWPATSLEALLGPGVNPREVALSLGMELGNLPLLWERQ
jgi:lipoate-protein ligase A